MKACTFFGHRDCPPDIRVKLYEILVDLIENHAVDMFYVGRQGAFDAMVCSVLCELAQIYPQIQYAVVIERVPQKQDGHDTANNINMMLPEGIETVHPRYAIIWRNRWLIQQSDFVVVYITHSWGGAAQFADMARKKGKIVINIDSDNTKISS